MVLVIMQKEMMGPCGPLGRSCGAPLSGAWLRAAVKEAMGFGALLNPQMFHVFPSGGVPLKLPLSFF